MKARPNPDRATRRFQTAAAAPLSSGVRVELPGVGRNREQAERVFAARRDRPLTERQAVLLAALTAMPQRCTDLIAITGLTRSQLQDAMSGLVLRDLARKRPNGWELA